MLHLDFTKINPVNPVLAFTANRDLGNDLAATLGISKDRAGEIQDQLRAIALLIGGVSAKAGTEEMVSMASYIAETPQELAFTCFALGVRQEMLHPGSGTYDKPEDMNSIAERGRSHD